MTDKLVTWFCEAVKVPASSTLVDIRSCLKIRLRGDTNLNTTDNALQVHIMIIILGNITEM